MNSGVTSIKENAFFGCTNLLSVIIPDSVTSIGDSAFAHCTSLTSVTIQGSETDIGFFAFQSCTSLTSVTISNGITSIGDYAFSHCTSLPSLNIPDSVTTIGRCAFSACTSLAEVMIPDSVTYIDYGAFKECSSLIDVTIPQNVTYIGGSAFAECTSLTSVALPVGVTIMSYAFRGTNIQKATYLDGSDLSKAEIYRFFPDTPLYNQSTSYSDQGSINTNLDNALIKNGVLVKYTGSGGNVVIPEGVTVIGDEAFYKCSNLTSVVIPNTVTHIGNWAFAKCTDLTSVYIPDSVSSIGNCAFAECTNLNSIAIPNSVTFIGSLAFSCTNLTSITLPNNIAELGEAVFSGCKALTSITFPENCQTAETLKGSFISYFGDLFSGCNALMEVNNIPNPKYTEFLSANKAFFNAWVNPGKFVAVQNGPKIFKQNAQDDRIIAVANQITAGLTSDYEKARAIASWVSENIVYDSSTSGDSFAQAPTTVLESNRAVCEGYTTLTRALLQAVGIPALYISGVGLGLTGESHAWNMAFVDGRWIYIDATWDEFDSNIFCFSGTHKSKLNLSFFVFASAVDTPSDWARNEVWDAICAGLVPNDLQAAYQNDITREEFCRLMVTLLERSMGMDIDNYLKAINLTVSHSFSDTNNAAVLAAHTLGIVTGTTATTFNPNGSITREEAATMLARTAKVLGLTAKSSENFNDAEQFASWAFESIAFISGQADPITGSKVMNGTGNGMFSPSENFSCEQAILTTLRLFHCCS